MTFHLIISGFVQGIGYRQFAKKEAKKLGLTGWVTNLPNGKVEVLVQGEKEKIDKFVTYCWQGPFLAQVKDIIVGEKKEEESYDDFLVVG